jgi:hypothetical protein
VKTGGMGDILNDLLNCCRFCTSFQLPDEKSVQLSKSIKTRFTRLTEISLLESDLLSSHICESCNSKLCEFWDFRNEILEQQQRLYEAIDAYGDGEVVVVAEEDDENEYLETENECIESMPEDEYIVEELEQYSESELIITSSNSDVFYQDQEVEECYEYEPVTPTPNQEKKTKVCEICNQVFAASGIYHHMMRFHSGEYRFFCDYCKRGFNLKNDLIMHIKKHLSRENRKKFPCSVCSSVLLSSSALANHEKLFHSEATECHPCEYCNKEFRSRMKYLQHRRTVHENSGQFPCSVCSKVFPTRPYLDKHIENVHGELKPCPVCEKLYKPASLKRHMQSHDEKKHKCPYPNCGKKYQMKLSLKHHIAAYHENDGNINCEYCGSSFLTKRHLTRHITRQHTSVSAP